MTSGIDEPYELEVFLPPCPTSSAWFGRRPSGPASGKPLWRFARQLDQARRAHSAADAHGDHGIATLATFELVQRGGDLTGAGGSQRVPDGDGAAVDVHPVERQAQLTQAVDGLRGERLVHLVEIDLVDLEAGLGQELSHGRHGA